MKELSTVCLIPLPEEGLFYLTKYTNLKEHYQQLGSNVEQTYSKDKDGHRRIPLCSQQN